MDAPLPHHAPWTIMEDAMDSTPTAARRAGFTFIRLTPPFGRLCDLQDLVRASTGFARFFFALRQPFPVSAPSVYAYDDYPDSLRRHYDEQRAWLRDPVLDPDGSDDTVHWQRGPLWAGLPAAAGADAVSAGIAFRFPLSGGRHAILALSDAPAPASAEQLEALRPAAYHICRRALDAAALERKLDRTLEATEALTRRELHVLRLSADGFTAEEIANQIFVARSTVNFHIKRITQKLHARNKTQAIAKAALMSLL
ncbi:helix-turn-helix transcriptional regulator [Pseudomonas mangiferae]|uniref:HTH luxR-type domain-containing protein n=1 Tax=Pseudomonas mangiferae TaxID=2593654 RepID=A0A553GVV6_9PSED|nr:LuxR family transcriptional regulator [Pseudomonas mangiferae]TRX73650.1 hypothetical protein FM069_16060 [Pseudomonas mangiferae]